MQHQVANMKNWLIEQVVLSSFPLLMLSGECLDGTLIHQPVKYSSKSPKLVKKKKKKPPLWFNQYEPMVLHYILFFCGYI